MILNKLEAGQGPALVLLHGFPLNRWMWSLQLLELASPHCHVIAPDLPGHGTMALSPNGHSVDTMADEVIRLLDHMGLTEPVVVGGLSMGGYVALSIAVRYPHRLRGLVLLNTRAGADTPETAKVREEIAQTIEKTGDSSVVLEIMLPKLLAPATYQDQPEIVEMTRDMMASASPEGVAATSRALAARPSRIDDLPNIRLPTLVIAGANDQLIPLSESESLASAIPGAELVIIPDSGHLSPRENPEATNAAILGFLGRIA